MEFKKVHDILVDETGVPLIKNGDFVVGESTLQHQRHILLSSKGDFLNSPLSGAGLPNFFLDDFEGDEVRKAIQSAITFDGQVVAVLKVPSLTNIELNGGFKL